MAACTKENPQDTNIPVKDNQISLKAKVEDYTSKGTYDANGKFTWAEGDQIGVYMWKGDDKWTEPLTLQSVNSTATEAVFGSSRQSSEYDGWGTFAYYPWNGWNNTTDYGTNAGESNGSHIYFHLKYENSYPNHLIPLAAKISNNTTEGIEFKQIAAGIKVTLKNVPAKASKVSLTIPGKKIEGWFGIAVDNIGTDSLVAEDSNSNNTIFITFSEASSTRDEMSFVFPVPTMSFQAMTIGLYNGNNLIWSKSANASAATTLSKGTVLSMPNLTVPSTKTISVGIISYVLNETDSDISHYKVRSWGGIDGENDVVLTATGGTEQKNVGYWPNNQQHTFTMCTASIPIDITGFKVWNSSNDKWYGDNASSTITKAYIFNYDGDKAVYE